MTRSCSLTTFTANETISNLTQYELPHKVSNLLKASLYFSIQTDKSQKLEIFTIFENNHRLFINNLKSGETKSQIKVYLSYLAFNSYLRSYKTFPHVLHQHRVFVNLIINKDIATMKPNERNKVVILDWKLYNNAI